MTEVEVTVKYRIKLPDDVFEALDKRDDGSLTELVAVCQSRIDIGSGKVIRQIDEDIQFGCEALLIALLELNIERIDWEGSDDDWDWEGI